MEIMYSVYSPLSPHINLFEAHFFLFLFFFLVFLNLAAISLNHIYHALVWGKERALSAVGRLRVCL